MIVATEDQVGAFERSAALMLDLHRVMKVHDPDGEEADRIRDAITSPWHEMSAAEQDLVRGLSADLYKVGADRVVQDEVPDAIAREVKHAQAEQSAGAVLALLRLHEHHLPPADVAFLRGVCWSDLGQLEVAITFLFEATRIVPESGRFEAVLLSTLVRAGRVGEAQRRVEMNANTTGNDPARILASAQVLFVAAGENDLADPAANYKAAIDAAERGLELVGADPDDLLKTLAVAAYLHCSLTYDALRLRERAIASCRAALQLDPDSEDALLILGWLNYDDFPDSERNAFRLVRQRQLAAKPLGIRLAA